MDVLRNLFGNLSAGIIRLLVTVGILAAVYFFVVKPTLETTSEISHEVNVNVQKSFQQTDLGDINKTIDDVNRQVQREIKQSLRAVAAAGRRRQADPLHPARAPERQQDPALQRTVSVAVRAARSRRGWRCCRSRWRLSRRALADQSSVEADRTWQSDPAPSRCSNRASISARSP